MLDRPHEGRAHRAGVEVDPEHPGVRRDLVRPLGSVVEEANRVLPGRLGVVLPGEAHARAE